VRRGLSVPPRSLLDPNRPPRYREDVERLFGYGLGGIGLIIVASSVVGQVFAIADGRPETAVGLTAGVIGGAILYRVGFAGRQTERSSKAKKPLAVSFWVEQWLVTRYSPPVRG
jgi:hypothetical protein